MSTDDPERLLSQALRAQAVMGGSGRSAAEDEPPADRSRRGPHPVLWWLTIIVIGLAAGGLAGLVSLI
ncbi:hypothetical protein [Actinoalloteichus hymeniacidonis]|uniref:hypothetical protein n=1 Tax=Actinoalloteichus hymeniacidonis TaxID=340345 RepID=UPI0012FCFB9D|nr:hypothetical protein [Actinoalloteichus hymeniacidonis]MBB5905883.1 hypothetical protein [Actinoalloteichus hymeniacidonis]